MESNETYLGQKSVYREVQNPLWITLIFIAVPVALIVGSIFF